MIFSLAILWSSRPILVSSNSILPHGSAFFSAIVLTISSILRRASTPFSLSCKYASCAASQASLASWNTPYLPRNATLALEVFLASQPHEEDKGADAGAGGGAATAAAPFLGTPFNFPSTSATTSRIKVSFTALIK